MAYWAAGFLLFGLLAAGFGLGLVAAGAGGVAKVLFVLGNAASIERQAGRPADSL